MAVTETSQYVGDLRVSNLSNSSHLNIHLPPNCCKRISLVDLQEHERIISHDHPYYNDNGFSLKHENAAVALEKLGFN